MSHSIIHEGEVYVPINNVISLIKRNRKIESSKQSYADFLEDVLMQIELMTVNGYRD